MQFWPWTLRIAKLQTIANAQFPPVMNPKLRTLLPALVAILVPLSKAGASILVSNLGEPNHLAATVDNNFQVAESFVAGATATLDAVSLQFSLNPSSAGLALKLYADNAGSPATSALTDFQLDVGTRFTPVSPLTVSIGTTYWVVATAIAPLVSWDGTSSVNDTGTSGWSIGNDHREKGFGGPWGIVSDSLKMSVEATLPAVPEPSALAVVSGVGLLAFGAWRRCRCTK